MRWQITSVWLASLSLKKHDEFVATDPADKIGAPHSGAKTPGHHFPNPVSRLVPKLVVDRFELRQASSGSCRSCGAGF